MSPRTFTFDPNKALEVILYIANRSKIHDVFHVCKIPYFADIDHLNEFGRLIAGDTFYALEEGPISSGIYDIVKFVRGDGTRPFPNKFKLAFSVDPKTHNVSPSRDADLDQFSDSEIECLDNCIREYGHLTFAQLWDRGHEDQNWKATQRNAEITVEQIAKNLPDSELLLAHLNNPHPG